MSEEYSQYPWLFKGAYATYSGTSSIRGLSGSLETLTRIEVKDLDLANQRAKIHVNTTGIQRAWPLSKKLGERKAEGWVKIGERTLPTTSPVILESEYEGLINIKGLGVRRCFVQHYLEVQPRTRIVSAAEIMFWDKEFEWPLQYMAIAIYKSKIPSSMLADALKDSLRMLSSLVSNLSGSSGIYLDDALKNTENEILREWTHTIHLRETNIPGLKEAIQEGSR